jgi:signal transduction histidine kinase
MAPEPTEITQQGEAQEPTIAGLSRQVSALERLAEISASLSSTTDLDTIIERIMAAVVELTDCEEASVLLWNTNKHQLVFAAATNAGDVADLIGMSVPMSSIAGTIFETSSIVDVVNTASDDRHYDKVDKQVKFVTRSILGAPLAYQDHRLGVVEAINKRNPPWTAADKRYLSILASQAAVALRSAQLVTELRRANEDLSKLDQLKSDFIAIASHELRTPLGIIMGYAGFLEMESSPEGREHASRLMHGAERLKSVIDDMVNLRYLQQGAADLHLRPERVDSLLEEARAEFARTADAQRIELLTESLDHAVWVHIDQGRLLMALGNVVKNACAFTTAGGRVVLRSLVTEDDEVWLTVEDSGIGVLPGQLDRIFEPFYQVEDHMIRSHEGLGIGLTIAREVIEAHGGRIWAESRGLAQGTSVIIALPRFSAQPPGDESSPPAASAFASSEGEAS